VASIRSEAFRILRERRAEGHLEAMAGALADPDPQVRKQAALFIDQACAVDPSRFGTALLDLLDDPVTETRIAAIRRAIALDAADRVPALIELLADADEDVRAIAEEALCRIARPEHLWLLHAATARGEGARGAMVQAIGREPGRPLTPLARIDDEKVWRRVLEAAAAETPAERILLLAPLLKHTEEWVCEETMRAIALTLGDLLWTDPI